MKKRSTHLFPVREKTLRPIDNYEIQEAKAVLGGFQEGNVEGSFGAGELNQAGRHTEEISRSDSQK